MTRASLAPGGLEAVDPLTDPLWDELFERAPESTIFHHRAWLGLISSHYRYPISAWCLAGPDGRVAAGLPVALVQSRLTGARLVAIPFSDACPALIDPTADADIATRFADALAQTPASLGLSLEVRAPLAGAADGTFVTRFVQHRLTLNPDVDQVVEGFTKTYVRRAVSKARRAGVTIERRIDLGGLRRFYALHLRTRRRQGVPTQPLKFILRFSELFDSGFGFVLLARYQGRDIAGAVFLTGADRLMLKYAASDPRFLSVRPNNLVYMEAIRWGCEHGQRVLDFGRTDEHNVGLREFKNSWGAAESPLTYTYPGGRAPAFVDGRLRRGASVAIQHLPPLASRLAGELLYRHFG